MQVYIFNGKIKTIVRTPFYPDANSKIPDWGDKVDSGIGLSSTLA
jgi:hypothetical protein